MKRHDIILKVAAGLGDYGSTHKTYCQSVHPTNAKRIAECLNQQGEHVLVFTHNIRKPGRLLYELRPD